MYTELLSNINGICLYVDGTQVMPFRVATRANNGYYFESLVEASKWQLKLAQEAVDYA